MTKPFAGIRILDFTRYVAGPYGTYQLALLGADVIKIEPKTGDEMRQSQVSKEWAAKGLGPSFMGINSNKRSLTLDLQKPKAAEIVKRLVATADIVWENFRPGVMDRFGLGYEALKGINPLLIYCAVSGFGQNGPERGTAAFDGKLQAMSGIMSITGHEDKGPTRAGFALCDTIGAMTAAFAVSSALYQRTVTGEGQFVDVAMLDAALAFIPGQVAEYTVTGHIHRQFGNLSSTGKVTGNRFKAGEGDLMLAVMTERQFANLMKGLGREDTLADPRFADWPSRSANEPALRAIIEDALAADSAKNWEQRLTAMDVPCAGIWSISEIVHHPQLAHRDVLQTVPSDDGELTLIGSGFRLAHGTGGIDRPPPKIGEHNAEILGEAGYTTTEITAFAEEGVV
ncbi:MAG TPA: CoA transferase [Stellaceae bacterium]|jgi:crotonobetainyl-CoA:carnitine CoA-transferase CaiB-like acyl-CoA transferase|nr:CoA transferase [Stellaceae bacterium]